VSSKDDIGNLLHRLGLSSKYNGFSYIYDALYIMREDMTYRLKPLKYLYIRIANGYKCNYKVVERDIRNCIEKSWYKTTYETIKEIFGSTLNFEDSRPTNREFLLNIFDFLKFNK